MSWEACEMLNGDNKAMKERLTECPMEPELTELAGAIRVLAEKVETLVHSQREVTRWLLVVVCVIALGRSAIDLGKAIVSDLTKPAQAIEELK